MDIALFMNTHGLGMRDDEMWRLQEVPATEMRPAKLAQRAEKNGFHSVWFSDHVLVTLTSESLHVANPETRQRAYPPRPNMLDGAVVMGAVAVSTERIKMSPSVLIAPYRNPLSDARQFATVDVLSNGRLIMGVGAGWMAEEFDSLGLPYEHRLTMTEECIEIYKRSWTQEVVEFKGQHYQFVNVSMDPKPVQKPRPPIIFGGITNVTARLAARHCDGFYPIFLDPYADPNRYAPQQDVIRKELDKAGRDPSQFAMIGCVSAYITDANHPEAQRTPRRRICTGTPEQVLEDLQQFADAGYGMMILHFDAPNAKVEEIEEQVDRAGKDIIPKAKAFKPKGEWRKEL